MSLTRSRYKKLGLEPINPLQDRPHRTRQQPMGDKNKYDGVGYPIKMFLEEALTRQRNIMMENCVQILRRIPTGEAYSSSGHATPFKVHANFDIPLFEGLIDPDAIDKWLNMLEGYFSVHNFFDRENISFSLLKVIPHVKDWWDTDFEKRAIEKSTMFVVAPNGIPSGMPSKNNTTLLEAMRTIHQMDHPTSRKGPDSTRFHQYFPYPAHQIGYQRILV
jgi:hypothetical protein